jgi:hypothetical protein
VLFSKEALSCVVAIGKKEEREREISLWSKTQNVFFLEKSFLGTSFSPVEEEMAWRMFGLSDSDLNFLSILNKSVFFFLNKCRILCVS